MAKFYHSVSIYLTIIWHPWLTPAIHRNTSCEHGENCDRTQNIQELCPPGYYCSVDLGKMFPCPAGSFRSGREVGESSHCIDCPVNFFNNMVGQKACFPCGSEAIQPEEGQTTCVCRGEGQVFQPSDSRCPCAPGYQLASDTNTCVQIAYDICRDATIRNQEGQCLSKEEWTDYCSNWVCVHPEDYQGYDKVLGLCICQTVDLDKICNAECRRRQNQILQIICVEETPKVHVIDSSGAEVHFTTEDIFGPLADGQPVDKMVCSSSRKRSVHSVYVVTSTGQGFWGIYNAHPQLVKHIFEGQVSFPLSNLSAEERTLTSHSISGVLNPTTCIHVNDFIMFVSTKQNYPMYDVNNLYNSNPGFDWGKFRTLAEELWLSSRPYLSLLYQFQEPGVYVFKLNSNHYKKMYIRVMVNGGQCYEDGPFFPTAPRHIIRNGISKIPQLLLKPDWPAITGILTGLLLILITCILILFWFKDLGWKQKAAGFPQFRKRQLKFNLDSYSSKGSTVSAMKKLHPKMRIKGHVDRKWEESNKKKYQKFLVDDEFWDHEQQVDMECFNTHIFYDILLKQSLLVTAKLGHLKEEVKIYYEKLVYEVSTLKEVFVKCLSISGKQKRYSSSLLESYSRKKTEAEQEMTKRKKLAAEYEEIVNKEMNILQQDMKCQEEHCAVFNGSLRECLRLLEMLKIKNGCQESGTKVSINYCQKLILQLADACNRMYTAVMKESERLKAWGVLGEGTGAHLVNKERTRALTKRDLIALDGSVRECDLVYVNATHGLLTPAPHSVMLLSSHYLMPVPNDYFVHSETGKVLPIAGNVSYDPSTSQLIITVDSAFGEICKTETFVFPFVPYPMCPNTGLPVQCNLPSIQHHQKQEALTLMLDSSGMEVPILAATIHPQTHQWIALGGSYIHPLTSILSPIELGGPVIDAKTGKIFPILGVGLDSTTGHVIPVGGLVSASGMISVMGDDFCEPLSGKKARLQGAALSQGKVVPHAGGYQALLESSLLMAQINVIESLKMHKHLISEEEFLVQEEFEQAHSALQEAIANMNKSLAIRQRHMTYRMYNVSCQQRMAADFKCHGGNLGMIIYPRTELWISAVLGMEIPDPGPSDMMVPILGVEHNFIKGHLIPLAGTMEDSHGKGLVPIKVGATTIDPIMGDSGPVIGARTDPLTGIVMPVVQPWGSTKGKDHYLLGVLEKELKSRDKCWQNQKNREEELLKELHLLILYIIDAAKEGKTQKICVKDKAVYLEEICQSTEAISLRETQRRSDQNLNSLSLKISQLPFVTDDNTEEMEQQMIFLLVVRKTMEKLIQFCNKMEEESERLQTQLREWQKRHEQTSEEIVRTKQTMVTLTLVDEFEDHMLKRLVGVDVAYSRLQYVREHIRLQGHQAKSFLLGTSPQYLNSQASYWNVVVKEVQDLSRNLTPMLKYFIQMMEENKNSMLLTGVPAPASGYSSRSTLKASAANSDSIQVAPNGDTEKVPPHVPWLTNAEIIYRHQGYLFRFLTEKQASELVHLERLLVAEEMTQIWSFYESYNISAHGSVKEILSKIISSPKDNLANAQCGLGKELRSNLEREMHVKWHRLLEDLSDVHSTAFQALYKKHLEEVKSMGLNPGTVIPENYFSVDFTTSIMHLAEDMLSIYEHQHSNANQEVQGMSSADAKLCTEDKCSQNDPLRTIAAKFVKQELLTQIRTYGILDAYNKLQVDNCVREIQKILYSLHYEPSSGKRAAEEAANAIEESQVEKLIEFLRKYYKEEQLQHIQCPLSEMQAQLKEEHCSLTERLLQEKNKLLFQELTNSENRHYMEHVVCCVLSQRHLCQIILLLQEAFKSPKHDQEKLSQKWRAFRDDTITAQCQEDIWNLCNNKTEASVLLMEQQNVIKRIQMREHHLEQIASGLKEYCSDKVHILTCVEEAYHLANELRTFREQKLKKLKEELKDLSELAKAKEKNSSLGREEERVKEEKELLKHLQEKQVELEQIHRKQISEERLKLQDQLERGELNSVLKQKLIKEHDESVAFLGKSLQRQIEMLSLKLEEDIKKKQEEEMNRTNRTSTEHIHLQNADQNILALLADNISIFQQAEQIAASRIALLGPQLFSFIYPPDGDAAKIIESSPILTLLKEVDTQLRTSAQNARIIHGNESDKDKGNTFRDILDLQLTTGSKLTIVKQDELTLREGVIYHYGIYILTILQVQLNVGEFNVHVASSLPENKHKGNAFAHSFYYQKSENKLYVSREYLKSAGSFIVLIAHCVSHMACDDFNDDTNPFFLRLFYQAIRLSFNEGFLSRLQKLPSGEDNTVEMSTDTDPLSNLLPLRIKTAMGRPVFQETLNSGEEMFSQYKTEVLVKNILSAKKRELFNQSFKHNAKLALSVSLSPPVNEDSCVDSLTTESLEEKLDQLNFQLLKILEKETESQLILNDEDRMCSYFEMITIEKDCLRKQIESLEENIDKQNSIMQ
ncbi:uncharacterized protein RCH25_007931 [Pelodytes ibericus]